MSNDPQGHSFKDEALAFKGMCNKLTDTGCGAFAQCELIPDGTSKLHICID